MARITIKEAVAIAPVSESTLRRDIKSGKVSSEKDDRGRRRIDTAELARAYGQLRQSIQPNDTQMNAVDTPNNRPENTSDTPDTSDTPTDNPKIISLLENQIDDLKNQLERAEVREDTHIAEKKELHDRLAAEQEKTRLLMLPKPPSENENENENENEKQRGWLLRLIGA